MEDSEEVDIENKTIIDRVSIGISHITMFIVPFIVAIIAYEVFMRYVMFSPTLWVNEMSLWLGGMIYLFAGLYTMEQRAHIRITALYGIMPRWLKKVSDVISVLCITIFAAGVAIGGWASASRSLGKWELYGTAWNPPIPATMKPLVIIVTVLLALQAINNLISDWNRTEERAVDLRTE